MIRMRPNISSPRKSDESSQDSSIASPNPQGYSQSPQFLPQIDFLSPSSMKQKHKFDPFSSGPGDSTKSDAKKIRLSNVPLSEYFVDNEPFRESDGLPRSWMDNMKPVFDKNNASAMYVDAKFVANSMSSPSVASDADESPTMTNISNPFPQIFTDDLPDFADEEVGKKGGKKPVADCNVCGDRAIAHMHYGGICCYSCKAFFRRASQTGNDKNYKCKKDQDCVVSVANRRACQYCRFIKCLEIGMKPTWVLSDKQCQIRFRKGKGDGKVKVEGGGVVVKIEDGVDEEIKPLIIKIDKPLIFTFTTEEDKTVKRMCEKYIESKEMHSFSLENNQLFNRIFSNNSTETEHDGGTLSAFDLSGLIRTVIKKNLFFLKSNHLLNDLDPLDLVALVKKNMSESCHLRGAIRFNTKSKNFMWYFNTQDTMQLAYQKPGGSSDPTQMKNAVIGQTDLAKYYTDKVSGDIFKVVHRLCDLGLRTEVYLILVFVSLFSSDGISLVNRPLVETSQVETLLLLHRYLIHIYGCDIARMKLSQIMGVMVDLREVCEKSKECQDKSI